MSDIKRIRSNSRFSEAAVFNGVVYVSGQVDLNEARSVRAQTENVLKLIDSILEEAGSDKEHLLRATVYLANIGDLHEMNKAWESWLDADKTPSRSVVQCQLPSPAWLVQISVIAAQK